MQPYSQPLFWTRGVSAAIHTMKYWFNGLPEPGVVISKIPSGAVATNVLPTYGGANSRRTSGPSISAGMNPLPTANPGDLLICAFGPYTDFGGNVNQDWAVNAPWQICASYRSGTKSPRYLAYAYHTINLAVPTWTTTGATDNYQGQIFAFKNAKMSSPMGAVQGTSVNASGSSIAVSSITATAANSLALLVHFNRGSTSPPWPPAGWTDLGTGAFSSEIWTATKPLVNAGDTTGSVTLSYTVAIGGAALINIEILSNPTARDFWFSGLPEQLIKG